MAIARLDDFAMFLNFDDAFASVSTAGNHTLNDVANFDALVCLRPIGNPTVSHEVFRSLRKALVDWNNSWSLDLRKLPLALAFNGIDSFDDTINPKLSHGAPCFEITFNG